MPTSQYEIPQFGTSAPYLHGWLLEAVQEGESWLATQRPTSQWQPLMERFSMDSASDLLSGMSNTIYPKDKRIARELVASLAGFRHEGEFSPVANRDLYPEANVLTKLDEHWNREAHAYSAYRAAIQYAVILGTGYLSEEWDKHFHGAYRGDIRLSAIAPGNVTFVQLPADGDMQRAYGVLIRYELPLNLARAIYGAQNRAFADSLRADRSSPGWVTKGLRKVQEFLSPALRAAGRDNKSQDTAFPTVDIYHLYTMDRTINTGPFPLTMGTAGTNWQYHVPALGDAIPTGLINPATGQELTRPAVEGDCVTFPLRRLTIFARSTPIICFDNSSPWWHGQVPLARIRFDDLPWEALGRSLIGLVKPIQDGVESMMRAMEDSAAARLDPPAVYDDNLVSSTWAQAFNPRKAGSRAAAPLSMGDVVKYPVPWQVYDVPQWVPEFISKQEERMDYLTAVQDLTAISKARQIPAADTIEKLLEMAGPIVQDMVRQVEEPLTFLGQLRKAYYFQFYTGPRMLQGVGEEAEGMVGYQFTPEKIIPAGSLTEPNEARNTRIRRYMHEFQYTVTQSGISELNRMTTKLFYLQLQQRGFPISWWTFAKVAQIPNFGAEPKGTNSELEMWIAQQHMLRDLQVELATETAQAGAAGSGLGADQMGAGALPQVGATGAAPEGRPPSNTAPPRMVTKDHGARSTIETSR